MDTNIDKSHCFSNIDTIRYCRLIAIFFLRRKWFVFLNKKYRNSQLFWLKKTGSYLSDHTKYLYKCTILMQDCSLFRKDAACPFIHLKNSNLFNYTIIEKKIQYAVNIRSSSIYNKYKTILYYIIFTRHFIYRSIVAN